MQNDELEGGATALAMVFVYFGKIIPVSKIILGFKDLRNGYTAADIVRSAKKRGGFHAKDTAWNPNAYYH